MAGYAPRLVVPAALRGLNAEAVDHLVEGRGAELQKAGSLTLHAVGSTESFPDKPFLIRAHCLAEVDPLG